MRQKRKYFKQKAAFLGIMLMGALLIHTSVTTYAEEAGLTAKIAVLQEKFPSGKYWNHVGSTKDNSDGYTNKPCTEHKASGVNHVYNTGGCTCNHFAGGGHLSATQCMGFANKLGYDVFGNTKWTTYNSPSKTQITNIKVGDIVRINGSHSVFVIAKTGNSIMVAEANYPNGCQILWGRIINLATVTVSYYEHANNYDAVVAELSAAAQQTSTDVPVSEGESTTEKTTAVSTSTVENTTEKVTEQSSEQKTEPYTGWKKAEDGIHYQYWKSDVLQKKKWITVGKKKYYLDKKGYRVTGFYGIGKRQYYFNKNGVLQKKKWITVEGESYYLGNDGYVLKTQWLYKGKTLVYVTEDGRLAHNELVNIGGETYYFSAEGKRSKGFKKYDGKYYYCNSSGIIQKKKWIKKGSKKYYVQKSGVRAQTKLLKVGKYQYYFDTKGCLVKNKHVTYNGKIYKADKNGRCKFLQDEPVTEKGDLEQSTTEQAAAEQNHAAE